METFAQKPQIECPDTKQNPSRMTDSQYNALCQRLEHFSKENSLIISLFNNLKSSHCKLAQEILAIGSKIFQLTKNLTRNPKTEIGQLTLSDDIIDAEANQNDFQDNIISCIQVASNNLKDLCDLINENDTTTDLKEEADPNDLECSQAQQMLIDQIAQLTQRVDHMESSEKKKMSDYVTMCERNRSELHYCIEFILKEMKRQRGRLNEIMNNFHDDMCMEMEHSTTKIARRMQDFEEQL